jgi:hypothetical protein
VKDIVFRRFSEAAERNAEELAVTRSTLRKIGLQLIARENEVSRLQLELERVTAERDALRRDRIETGKRIDVEREMATRRRDTAANEPVAWAWMTVLGAVERIAGESSREPCARCGHWRCSHHTQCYSGNCACPAWVAPALEPVQPVEAMVWKCGNCGVPIADRVNAYALPSTGQTPYCTKHCATMVHARLRAERDESAGGGT